MRVSPKGVLSVAGGGCRILVVDDSEDTARSMAILLEGMGHRTMFLTNPYMTIATVASFKPHIVFLDIGMPGMDGWSLAAVLRTQYPIGDLCLVALTAYGRPQDHVRSRQAGFDAHLVKPASVPLLESTIKTLFPAS